MKLHTVTFGCQMSAADGEELALPLRRKGFIPADSPQNADAILINTCTVRQHAEDRAVSFIGRLRPWKEERPERLLIVAGCAAELLGPWLKRRFPFVDLVVGAKSIEQAPKLIEEALRARFDWGAENRNAWPEAAGTISPVAAYVTIMRGCNYSCSYCIVPAVRGRELYRPQETALLEVREKAALGAREIMLLGQTVNSYRPRDGGDFADLLRGVQAVPEVERIRFMSPHPFYVNDRMVEAMAACPKVCRHLHLPLQSGADRILRLMRRNYTAAGYLEKVRRLRAAMPDLALTTDVIVGFPGETEQEFKATLDLVGELDPCSAYCFKFSPREGTEAAAMEGQLAAGVIEDRLARLLSAVDAGIKRHLESSIGRTVNVLLEDERFGRTEHFFKARLTSPGRQGDIVAGVVQSATKTTLLVDLP